MARIRSCSILLLHLSFVCLSETCFAFTMHMSYKPPTKSSVNAISKRISRPGYNIPSSVSPSRSASSSNAVAASLSAEAVSNPSFRSRVKDVVLGGLKNRIGRKPNVEVVEDINDFKAMVGSERKQFIAVMFHAPFCKACKAAAPHFFRMAKKYSNVKFVSVPLTESNSIFLKGLGVSKFPFAHIYDPEKGLVDELPVLRKLVPQFEEKLRSYVTRRETDDDLKDTCNSNKIVPDR